MKKTNGQAMFARIFPTTAALRKKYGLDVESRQKRLAERVAQEAEKMEKVSTTSN